MRTTQRIDEVRQLLLARLRDGRLAVGDRFPSSRSVAQHYQISLQTADRLVGELVELGLVVRRRGSGTYVAGDREGLQGVAVYLPQRANRPGSLGSLLHRELTKKLRRARLVFRAEVLQASSPIPFPDQGFFPLVWECPELYRALLDQQRRCLLLYDRPAQGLESLLVDSVSVDDFSGGVMAAQILRERHGSSRPFVILSGPSADHRSAPRVAGFLSVTGAKVIESAGWHVEDGLRCAPSVFDLHPVAVFCGNDRIAEGLILYSQSQGLSVPDLIGFDGAPVSEHLNFSSIAVPWSEVAEATLRIIQKRIADPTGSTIHQVISPQPILRSRLARGPV
ncbi:MAG: GntR family transcriptional regulator [Fimbriimonadaceae bacterium]|nr:GntR family transcriptional regulator [Fimbriimonadaceae bacterium]